MCTSLPVWIPEDRASGHRADLGLGTGLGGAPAAYDATRLDVWPPCGHRQRLAKGGAMGSPSRRRHCHRDRYWRRCRYGVGHRQLLQTTHHCVDFQQHLVRSVKPTLHTRQALLRCTSSTRGCACYRTNGLLVGRLVVRCCTTWPIADRATAARLAAACDLVAPALLRRGRRRRTFLDGAILQHIVEEPILSER